MKALRYSVQRFTFAPVATRTRRAQLYGQAESSFTNSGQWRDFARLVVYVLERNADFGRSVRTLGLAGKSTYRRTADSSVECTGTVFLVHKLSSHPRMTLRGALSEAWCAAMKASYTCMSWVNIEAATG